MKIKYIDTRPMTVDLKKYRGGVKIPNEKHGNIFDVTEDEAKRLLRWRNGDKPCWELAEERPRRRTQEVHE